jgi:hypothetical protein
MSQFLVVKFNISAKGSLARRAGHETVAVELPEKHVADWKFERPHLKLSDEEIAIELAQHVAIAAAGKFLRLTNSPPQRARNPLAHVLATASSDYE